MVKFVIAETIKKCCLLYPICLAELVPLLSEKPVSATTNGCSYNVRGAAAFVSSWQNLRQMVLIKA